MRSRFIPIAAVLALTLTGCAYHEGETGNDIEGRLVDEEMQPVGLCPLVISYRRAGTSTQPAESAFPTSADGDFSRTISTGIHWVVFSFMGHALGSVPANPPVKAVYLSIEQSSGLWIEQKVEVRPADQNKFTIQLGDVVVPRQK